MHGTKRARSAPASGLLECRCNTHAPLDRKVRCAGQLAGPRDKVAVDAAQHLASRGRFLGPSPSRAGEAGKLSLARSQTAGPLRPAVPRRDRAGRRPSTTARPAQPPRYVYSKTLSCSSSAVRCPPRTPHAGDRFADARLKVDVEEPVDQRVEAVHAGADLEARRREDRLAGEAVPRQPRQVERIVPRSQGCWRVGDGRSMLTKRLVVARWASDHGGVARTH